MPDTPTVHVIDDDDAARDSLDFLLGTAGLCVKTYASAEDFLARAAEAGPGCLVTDVRMPGISGLQLVGRLKQQGIGLPVIVMTGHGDVALAVAAMKAGAVDFIEKPFADETMLQAVDSALTRGAQSRERDAERGQIVALIAGLSGRERQVLDGLVSGKANKVIAYDLGISPRTVEVYRANLMGKMGASSLSDLVRMALLAGEQDA